MHRLLKSLREKHNLSQEQMGSIFGVKQATYYNWEAGKSKFPLSKITALMYVFDVSEERIFREIQFVYPVDKRKIKKIDEYFEAKRVFRDAKKD